MLEREWKILASVACAASFAFAATVTVNPEQTAQKIVGFGGGVVYYQSWITHLSEANQQALYDTAFTGLNLSLLRIGNWKQEDTTSIADDVKIVQAAKQRLGSHLKIEMSSWSAPASLKPSGSVMGNVGDSTLGTLKSSSSDPYGNYVYSEFASWWKRSFLAYKSAGIAPDYISIQNEPDMFAKYEETLFRPTETSTMAGYAQALAAVRDTMNTVSGAPKILGPEPLGIGYSNFQNYMKGLDDSKLDGYAYHLYHAGNGNDNSLANYKNPENFRSPMKAIAQNYGSDAKPIIMTEFCSMAENGVESYMVGLAHIMQVGFTDGKLGGYIAWELLWGEGKGQLIGVCTAGWGSCEKDEIVISPEYHAMRHYSKFVNPGWSVVSTESAASDLKTVAFKSENADSVTLVLVNTGNTEIRIDAPTVSGMNVALAVQSKENGAKSKNITIAGCYALPARSITSLVYTQTASAPSVQTCVDETSDPSYVEPSSSDTLMIVDYSKTSTAEGWSADSSLSTPVYGTSTVDGVSSYVFVKQAGCDQGDCGYKHAYFALSAEQVDNFAKCSDLVVVMHSAADTTAYVNIGGVGAEWVDYKYGVQAGSASWVSSSISLEKEAGNASNRLKFNSNASGFYISKIFATGCSDASIPQRVQVASQKFGGVSKIYDMQGRLVWKGELSSSDISGHVLHLQNLKAGVYTIRSGSRTMTAVKK